MSTILVVGTEGAAGNVEWRAGDRPAVRARVEAVDHGVLSASAVELTAGLHEALAAISKVGGVQLREAEVKLGVTLEGKVALLGIGGSAATETSIVLKFSF